MALITVERPKQTADRLILINALKEIGYQDNTQNQNAPYILIYTGIKEIDAVHHSPDTDEKSNIDTLKGFKSVLMQIYYAKANQYTEQSQRTKPPILKA
jgi:hypothetical protein